MKAIIPIQDYSRVPDAQSIKQELHQNERSSSPAFPPGIKDWKGFTAASTSWRMPLQTGGKLLSALSRATAFLRLWVPLPYHLTRILTLKELGVKESTSYTNSFSKEGWEEKKEEEGRRVLLAIFPFVGSFCAALSADPLLPIQLQDQHARAISKQKKLTPNCTCYLQLNKK